MKAVLGHPFFFSQPKLERLFNVQVVPPHAGTMTRLITYATIRVSVGDWLQSPQDYSGLALELKRARGSAGMVV